MAVSPASAFGAFGAGPPQRPRSGLDMATFMRLLTVQLANQNPLEPMSDRDFFAQMAQLGQVQGMDSMRASIEMNHAASLIGRTVTAVRTMEEGSAGGNSLVTGVVTRVSVREGERVVTVAEPEGGVVDVRLANIREIRL